MEVTHYTIETHGPGKALGKIHALKVAPPGRSHTIDEDSTPAHAWAGTEVDHGSGAGT